MNIFEQFGIKEVADVTIYAIDLDKYDDEIYIPIMHLDTLKVSTVEQTASQTSARGGVGNSELISWDFGKEISVSLQDALFTPASQSLMWGGKYGIKKPQLYGVFDPYVYPTDAQGSTKYIRKVTSVLINDSLAILVPVEYDTYWIVCYYSEVEDKVYKTILPKNLFGGTEVITNIIPGPTTSEVTIYTNEFSTGYIGQSATTIDPLQSVLDIDVGGETVETLFYEDSNIAAIDFICPCDGKQVKQFLIPEVGHYLYNKDGIGEEDQMILTEDTCPSDNVITESEEISQAVGRYTIEGNDLNNKASWSIGNSAGRPERAVLNLDKFGSFKYMAYEFVASDDPQDETCYYHEVDICDTSLIKCTDEVIDAYGYIWEDSSSIISSLEGRQESFYLDSIDLRFRIRKDNGSREIAIEYNSEQDNNYNPKIDIYKTIKQQYKDSNGLIQTATVKILVGSFYIIDDWNSSNNVPNDFAYLLNLGIENVPFLERMEKCQAKTTFAIDTDKNLRSSNYRYDKSYNQNELAVFINPKTMQPYESNAENYTTRDGLYLEGNFAIIKQGEYYYKWTRSKSGAYESLGKQIIVDATHFPGTYKIVGETYVRSRADGQDQRYQFEIPLCKLSSDTNITLEAAGDPTTFSMNFKVLRNENGDMIKLTQYNVEENCETGSTTVIPTEAILDQEIPKWGGSGTRTVQGGKRAVLKGVNYTLDYPTETNFTDSEADAPLDGITGTVSKIDDEILETKIRNVPYVVSPDVTLPNEELTQEGESYFENTDPYKILIDASKTYGIEQETHQEYEDGSIVPGSSVWNDTGEEVVTDQYLRENEFIFDTQETENGEKLLINILSPEANE